MRAYACGEIGTNTWITTPIEPYVNIETGVTETTIEVYDGRRPEFEATSCVKFPVEGRNPNRPLWVVIDFNAATAPQGAFDLGDPSDPQWQETELTAPEKNFLRQTFPEGDMDSVVTRGDVLRVIKPEGFRGSAGETVAEWNGI